MKRISLLGSTGSIGTQALQVARLHNIKVDALAAYGNTHLLEMQAREFNPKYVCICNSEKYADLKLRLSDTETVLLCGEEGLCEAAACSKADTVLNAVVGMAGLSPTLAAIEAGKDVALANKESLVAGGSLIMSAAKKHGVKILPVDSEHSAIFQVIQGHNKKDIKKVILTASGGPFFGMSAAELENVTLEDVLAHPVWNMGKKITVDSATLMNKGLEFIEAKWLFDLEPEQIEVVIHRECVIHSAVEFADNSVIAQLGVPDMRLPIQYALTYPKRLKSPVQELSLADYGFLSFARPDYDTFKCLKLCMDAIKKGGDYPRKLNAANETAVELFLSGQIPFTEISTIVHAAVNG
jgi:1-deoxy-D-xylulose-5-phosphate reductoisomerase